EPLMVPPIQLNWPETVSLPRPVSVPPESVNVLLIVEAAPRTSVPPESTMAFWLVRLWTESKLLKPWLTVTPALLMTTSSAGVGRVPVLQLAGVSQSPLELLIQFTVDGSHRVSRDSREGRSARRRCGRPAPRLAFKIVIRNRRDGTRSQVPCSIGISH